CADSSGFSSELTLARRKRPAYSCSSFSSTGFSDWQGPHQGAQNCTSTGACCEARRTSASKLASVISMGIACPSENGCVPSRAPLRGGAARPQSIPVRRVKLSFCDPAWLWPGSIWKKHMEKNPTPPLVGVVMGSASDWDVMQHAVNVLAEFGVAHETRVVSAHRMPIDMVDY